MRRNGSRINDLTVLDAWRFDVVCAAEARFQTDESLVEAFLEITAQSHDFAHGLHGRGQVGLRARELFKGKARDLGDHVVDARLKGGRRDFGHVVLQLIERVAHSQLGGDFGDREARCL